MKIFLIVLVTVVSFFAGHFTSWQVMSNFDPPTIPLSDYGENPSNYERLKRARQNSVTIVNRSIEKDGQALYFGIGAAVLGLLGSIYYFSKKDKKRKMKGY